MLSKKALNTTIAIAAVLAIVFRMQENEFWFTIFKPLTTILIISVPLLFGRKRITNGMKPYFFLIVYGLVFCLFGDVFLIGDGFFIYGLLSFLIAHILFAFAFMSIGGFKANFRPLIILSIIGLTYYLFLYGDLGDMAIPVLVYFLFILFMCWQGISLYLSDKKRMFLYVAVAVVLFMLSDSLLAFNKFKMPFQLAGILVLTTYWLAIGLIANSTTMD